MGAVMELNHHEVLQHQQKVSVARRDSKAQMTDLRSEHPALLYNQRKAINLWLLLC